MKSPRVLFANYLKIAWRNILKNKTYSIINILGLAVGMACFILIALFIQDELSYENFHAKADRLYRVSPPDYARTAPLTAPTLRQDIPEVESAVRLMSAGGTFRYEDQIFNEAEAVYVGPDFLNMFSLDFIAGPTNDALASPNTILISASTANKYFGNEPALGKILFTDTIQLQVAGVYRDLPANTHLPLDMVISFKTFERYGTNLETWNNNIYYTYALLQENTSPERFQQQLDALVEKHVHPLPNRGDYQLTAQNIRDIHLRSDKDMEITAGGSMAHIYIFGSIALIVLFIAGINYVNLATARATRRAREIGVRKSLGANFSQLVTQFLSESVLLSLLAFLIAFGMIYLGLPLVNQLAGKAIAQAAILNLSMIGLMLGFALLVGLLAGVYPAFVLSSFRPNEVLKGKIKSGWNDFLIRRGLVVLQFALSMLLIVGAGTVYQQLTYMENRPIGFDKEQILVLPFNWDAQVQQDYEVIKQQFLQNPNITSVTSSGDIPGRMATIMAYWAEGMPEGASETMQTLYVNEDFVPTYGIELIAGKAFNNDIQSDNEEGFLLNERAVAALGWTPETAIGKRFKLEKEGRIIGVVKDFHFQSLHQNVQPLVMGIRPEWSGYLSLRVNTQQVAQTVDFVETIWKSMVPNIPLEYYFLDDEFNSQYLAEERLSKIASIFSGLAVFIAAIGLFGLATFTVERRTKEIAVRKVLGASSSSILTMLGKDFGKPILAAILLAVPFALWAINSWLSNFAYHINVPMFLFVLAGLIVMGIAVAAISFQSIRATRVNPVKWLRNE